MSSSLYDNYVLRFSEVNKTKGAINTFKEYIDSKVEKIHNFICGREGKASIYLSSDDNTVVNKLVVLTNEQYEYCLSHEGNISLPIDDNGQTISVSCESVCDSMEENLGELKVQSEFIQYALTSETIEAGSFITRVRALSDNIPSYIITKYSQFCGMANSPVELLSNFFTTIITNKVSYENTYVSLVDPNQYVGNAWESAFVQVADTIASFFEDIKFDITKIGQFFQDVLDGLIALIKWGFSKLFGNLLTVYEKYSGAVVGIMDFPLFQVVLGTQSEFENWEFTGCTNFGNNLVLHAWDGTSNSLWMQRYGAGPQFHGYGMNRLILGLFGLTHEKDDDGRIFASNTQIVIPGDPFDLCLSIGIDQDQRYVLYANVVSDYGTWSKFSDEELKTEIWYSLRSCLQYVSRVVPMINTAQNVDDTSIKWTDTTEAFMYKPSSSHPGDLPTLLRKLNYTLYDKLNSTDKIINNQSHATIVCLLIYMSIMSRGLRYIDNGTWVDITDEYYEHFYNAQLHYYTTSYPEIVDQWNDTALTVDQMKEFKEAYRPYLVNSAMPVTIHYQSTAEQGREIINAFKAVIIAAIIAYVTYKTLKWTKKRRKDTTLVHAIADQYSWNYANNPTQENLEKFEQAYKKARKVDLVNNILGITTSASANIAANTSLTKLSTAGINASKDNFNTTDVGISHIKRLITGSNA